MQRLGELHHVDRARAGRDQVGPFEAVVVERVQLAGAEQRPAADVPPVADDRGQAGDGPHRHAAAAVPLQAVVQADAAPAAQSVRVLAGELLDVVDRQAR